MSHWQRQGPGSLPQSVWLAVSLSVCHSLWWMVTIIYPGTWSLTTDSVSVTGSNNWLTVLWLYFLRSGYSSVSFVWGIRVRFEVRVRVGVRVISLRDSFSVLLRPQHLSMLTTHGRKYTFYFLTYNWIPVTRYRLERNICTYRASKMTCDVRIAFFASHNHQGLRVGGL